MNIGIIGSGHIGATAARLFVAAGHDVRIANSRGPASLRELEDELAPRGGAATVEEAAGFGDLVLIATPLGALADLPAGELAGTIVVDANNYYPGRDGLIAQLDREETTSSELLAARLPGARVVKAFNAMQAATLGSAGDPGLAVDDRPAIYVAGDDETAKATVLALVDALGFAAIDTGSLAAGGRRQQPGAAVYGAGLTGAEARAELGL